MTGRDVSQGTLLCVFSRSVLHNRSVEFNRPVISVSSTAESDGGTPVTGVRESEGGLAAEGAERLLLHGRLCSGESGQRSLRTSPLIT